MTVTMKLFEDLKARAIGGFPEEVRVVQKFGKVGMPEKQ